MLLFGCRPVTVWLSSSYCPIIVHLSSGYCSVIIWLCTSPSNSLISLSYSKPAFSVNAFGLFSIAWRIFCLRGIWNNISGNSESTRRGANQGPRRQSFLWTNAYKWVVNTVIYSADGIINICIWVMLCELNMSICIAHLDSVAISLGLELTDKHLLIHCCQIHYFELVFGQDVEITWEKYL